MTESDSSVLVGGTDNLGPVEPAGAGEAADSQGDLDAAAVEHKIGALLQTLKLDPEAAKAVEAFERLGDDQALAALVAMVIGRQGLVDKLPGALLQEKATREGQLAAGAVDMAINRASFCPIISRGSGRGYHLTALFRCDGAPNVLSVSPTRGFKGAYMGEFGDPTNYTFEKGETKKLRVNDVDVEVTYVGEHFYYKGPDYRA